MGRHHLEALGRRKTWRVAGIVDPHPGFDVPVASAKRWADLFAMLAETRPRAAIVAVPPDVHEEVSRACLAAGCHVLVEKPICPSCESARRLAADFQRTGVVLFGGHSERFHPVFEALCRELPRIGEVRRIEAVRQGPPPPRTDTGGVVFDLAVHDLDLLFRLAGATLRVVGAECDASRVSCRADLEWTTGVASLEAAWRPQRRRTLRAIGTQGTLDADFLAPSLTLTDVRGVWRQKLTWRDPLESEHAAFRAACEGRFDAVADLAPQIEALRLAEGILRA
jgi:UDP-N-acetylglucosamine 3-dehydrogenase